MITHVVLLPQDPAAPALRLDVGDDGRVLARTRLYAGGETPPDAAATQGRTVLVVPGTQAPALWLELPARNPVQALAAARALVAERLAVGGESLHVAVAEAGGDEAPRPVVAVERALMAGWLERAAALGMSPDALVPDHLALAAPEGDEVVVVEAGDERIVRGRGLAFRSESALAALILEGRPQRSVGAGPAAEAILAAGARRPGLDLLQGEFARAAVRAGGGPGPRRAVALAALLALSPLLLWGAEAARYTLAARALEAQAAARADAALPEVSAGESPLAAVRAALRQARARDGFAHPATALFAAVPRLEDARLDRLSYAEDGVLRATLSHARPDALDALGDTLLAEGLTLQRAGTRRADGRLHSELEILPEQAP
ncbi:type II secretion system protein GspL [Luteimonas sp. RD2P54]|uniref:Type II secretion system protein GspL n=1 Tax=Luteimonas endophytica TaxID=3042023 RepID=A0ABT6JD64_9GAMM|nr:type II secretion system protein GspL [Luteimonas endophytica]MDH5824138.1 type II secretion system protein GspL [Luteimonas endophytica]